MAPAETSHAGTCDRLSTGKAEPSTSPALATSSPKIARPTTRSARGDLPALASTPEPSRAASCPPSRNGKSCPTISSAYVDDLPAGEQRLDESALPLPALTLAGQQPPAESLRDLLVEAVALRIALARTRQHRTLTPSGWNTQYRSNRTPGGPTTSRTTSPYSCITRSYVRIWLRRRSSAEPSTGLACGCGGAVISPWVGCCG